LQDRACEIKEKGGSGMKIYLAYAGVGGWTIDKVSKIKPTILLSFYYDKNDKVFQMITKENKDADISCQRG
jgi:hypothetical protein